MKKQQYIMTIITVIFLIGVGIYGHKTKQLSGSDAIAIVEETAVLEVADKTFSDAFEAKVSLGTKISILSKFRGSIIKVLVKNKQFVKKGQLLFEIERESSTSRLELATRRIDELEDELKRINERVEQGDFESDAQRINFNSRKDILTQAIVLAKQALDSVELQNEALLEKVYAPSDGVIDMISVALGGEVAKGHVLTYILPYEVSAKLSQKDIDRLQQIKGNYVDKQWSIKYGESTYQLKEVNLLNKSQEDDSSNTERIFVPIPVSLDGSYRKEEKVKVIVNFLYHNVVEVPIQTVVEQDNQKYIWVKGEKDDYEQQKISIVKKVDQNYLIHGKLNNKKVLLNPAFLEKK